MRPCSNLAFHFCTLFTMDLILTSQVSGSFLQSGIIHILRGLAAEFFLYNEVKFSFLNSISHSIQYFGALYYQLTLLLLAK